MNHSVDLAVIVALITAIAAIISPILTEIISQHGARKRATIDYFLSGRAAAYKQFITSASELACSPSSDQLQTIRAAYCHAAVYSSESTRQKMSEYVYAVERWESTQEINESLSAVLDAIHAEIRKV